jgi:light-regulated signal transduction histidine kinase (bacteriophytochrome)
MSMLIKSLLDFSRLGHDIKLTYVDCNKLVHEVIDDLENMIKDSNAEIKVTEMPELIAYETGLREVFQNLITNAIKFRKKDNLLKIRIGSERMNKKWKFSVSDNGIGISSAHFEKIFVIFQRLHLNECEYEGNGIGLANCKKIIQLQEGEIWVESSIGRGSTFFFAIPNLTV